MSVDKFGRNSKTLSKTKGAAGPPGIGFKLLPSGDYNIENKQLNNIARPEEPHQAATKEYVDDKINLLIEIHDPKNYTEALVKTYLDRHIQKKLLS